MTLNEFITANTLTMTVEWTDHNPNMAGSDDMDHWKCVVRLGTRRMTVVYSMGMGHHGAEPKLADVLDSLASDAMSADEAFEGWCSEYGYDPDSRTAERTYKAVRRSATKLRKFLGDEAFAALLDCDRL